MKNRTHFAFRIDAWTDDGENLTEHLAGVEDYQLALATYRAACERWAQCNHHLAPGRARDRRQRRMRLAARRPTLAGKGDDSDGREVRNFHRRQAALASRSPRNRDRGRRISQAEISTATWW